jgi:uncharacterized protein (TIGR03083 family)
MDTEETWRWTDQQRADLADFLETLTDEQWATPSLCGGWTVRDVAVHLTHGQTPWARMAWEALRSGFRFNHMIARVAREDASTPAEIVATLRGMVGGRRRPPGTAVADPLLDVLVHGQDVAVPLGVDRPMPIAPAVVAAERLWAMGFPFNARKRFENVSFTATDAPLRLGSGDVVTGPIRDIVLVLAGRQVGLGGLSGHTATLVSAFDPPE